jgi:hypothetical protein
VIRSHFYLALTPALQRATEKSGVTAAHDHAVTLTISKSRLKSGESNCCPAESVICTCQPMRSNRRALSTAATGLIRIVTTLCPFFEAWIAYVMASSQDTSIHGFEEVRGRRDGAFIMLQPHLTRSVAASLVPFESWLLPMSILALGIERLLDMTV